MNIVNIDFRESRIFEKAMSITCIYTTEYQQRNRF